VQRGDDLDNRQDTARRLVHASQFSASPPATPPWRDGKNLIHSKRLNVGYCRWLDTLLRHDPF
jgi:hypothetical protein